MKKNRIDELANQLAKSGKIDRLEWELKKLEIRTLTDAECEAWLHLYGTTAFQRGDREEARRRFLAAHEQFPHSAMIAFSLGQEFEFIGDLDRAFELFRQVRYPDAPGSHVLAAARYAYLWDRYDDGLRFLESIFEAYRKLGIVDDTFLYIRGLPFFSTAWSTAGALYELAGRLPELAPKTQKWAATLHDYDFQRLQSDLTEIIDGDLTGIARRARREIDEWKKQKWPVGFPSVRFAVIESKCATTIEGAEAKLDGVRLAENDHPWLADILLLARIAAHRRFGDRDHESALTEEFLKKQPYLFEPEHLFRFRLIQEQEPLKPRYRDPRLLRSRP